LCKTKNNLTGLQNFNESGEFTTNLNAWLDEEDEEDKLLAATAYTGMIPSNYEHSKLEHSKLESSLMYKSIEGPSIDFMTPRSQTACSNPMRRSVIITSKMGTSRQSKREDMRKRQNFFY
jgi:hypothetical protein